jgi:drug/metabolite transporter (DMT)-like permease
MTTKNAAKLLIAAAPFFHQLSHVVTKKRLLGRVSETAVIPAARLLYSGLLLAALAAAAHPHAASGMLSLKALGAVVLFGFVFRGLDCWLWYEAIARIPLARASALIPLSVAVSFFGAVLLLGERPPARSLAGLALIFASAAWFSKLGFQEPEPPGA